MQQVSIQRVDSTSTIRVLSGVSPSALNRLDRPACIHSQIVYLYYWQIEIVAKWKETICSVHEYTAPFLNLATI